MNHYTQVRLLESDIRAALTPAESDTRAATEQPLYPQLHAILKQDRPLQHTPEWFAMRRQMLTASNVASYIGQNKYCSKKRFLKRMSDDLNSPPPQPSANTGFDACLWGTQHEAEAAALYELFTGNRCYPCDLGLVKHPQYPFVGASPDRVLVDRPVLVEIKAPFRRVIVPDQVPDLYVPQVQTQMEVCDMDECHFVQFKPASLCTPGVFSVKLVRRDRDWWRDNITTIAQFAADFDRLCHASEQQQSTRRPVKRAKLNHQQPADTPATTDTNNITSMSPGVYDVYIDSNIFVTASALQRLTGAPATDHSIPASNEEEQ